MCGAAADYTREHGSYSSEIMAHEKEYLGNHHALATLI